MSDTEWIRQWEEDHLTSHADQDSEVANMNRTDFATMLAELEGK